MNIEEKIREIDFKDPEQIIKFYESNRLYYDNYQRLDTPENISDFIDIKLHYANSLTDKHHLDKVVRVLEEVSDLLEKLPKEHWNYQKSERHVRFLKAMALARQRKFKKAFPMFKRLVKEDPEHYYYKVWYDHSKLETYNWIFSGIAFVGVALIFGDLIFSLDEKLPFDIGIIGLIVIGLSYLTKKGLTTYLKKNKTDPQHQL